MFYQLDYAVAVLLLGFFAAVLFSSIAATSIAGPHGSISRS